MTLEFLNDCFELEIYYLFDSYTLNLKIVLFEMCKLIVIN